MNKRKQEGKPQTDSQAGNVGIHYLYNFQFDLIKNIGQKEVQNTYIHTLMHTYMLMCTHFKFNEEVVFLGRIYFRVYMLVFQQCDKS